MANSKTTNPMVLDTAEIVVPKGSPVKVRKFWYQAANDDQDVIVKDGRGNIIWTAKVGDVSVDGYNVGCPVNTTFDGLDLDTIDGGVLFVYV